MRPNLLLSDGDLDVDAELPAHADDVAIDLGLDGLVDVMIGGDGARHDWLRRVLLTSLTDPGTIVYRQDAVRDGLANRDVVARLHALALEALASEAEVYPGLGRSASSSLHRSMQLLAAMLDVLRDVRDLADAHAASFRSAAFTQLFTTLRTELDDGFFAAADEQLEQLRFPGGIAVGARVGRGGRGVGYVLREPPPARSWTRRVVGGVAPGTIEVSSRDRSAVKALTELRERGLERLATSLQRSSQHLHGFFEALAREVGFYVGAVRLHDALVRHGPVVFPEVARSDGNAAVLTARGLEDAGLRLRIGSPVVGNDVEADGKPLVLVTGANQGGKSTFLRSVGLAQLMMQAGLFVTAEAYRSAPAAGLFTHFKRGEDVELERGKLDEELARLSAIVERLEPGSLVLFNESFASTNEHEGSRIGQDVVRALLEAQVRVVLVTHGYDLATAVARRYADVGLFLRAERQESGERTYSLHEGAPEPTSYGMDLYEEILGT